MIPRWDDWEDLGRELEDALATLGPDEPLTLLSGQDALHLTWSQAEGFRAELCTLQSLSVPGWRRSQRSLLWTTPPGFPTAAPAHRPGSLAHTLTLLRAARGREGRLHAALRVKCAQAHTVQEAVVRLLRDHLAVALQDIHLVEPPWGEEEDDHDEEAFWSAGKQCWEYD